MNLENTTHTDNSTGEEKTVTIPAGFAVSQVEGENTISDGLVVIDKNGNEFVWVPVDPINFKRISGYYYGKIQGIADNKEPYIDGYEGEVNEYDEMYTSVVNNNGFYIGRYETGKSNNKTVIKSNIPAYTNVIWGNSISDCEGGAVELAKKFAIEQGYKGAKSTLSYGIQWDATLLYMDNNYINEDGSLYNSNSYIAKSEGKGWYSENYTTGNPNHLTGINVDESASNCIKNIYDMAGNVREWTMERHSVISKRVVRGGRYSANGNNTPSSCRDGAEVNDSNDGTGFRICLYLI